MDFIKIVSLFFLASPSTAKFLYVVVHTRRMCMKWLTLPPLSRSLPQPAVIQSEFLILLGRGRSCQLYAIPVCHGCESRFRYTVGGVLCSNWAYYSRFVKLHVVVCRENGFDESIRLRIGAYIVNLLASTHSRYLSIRRRLDKSFDGL